MYSRPSQPEARINRGLAAGTDPAVLSPGQAVAVLVAVRRLLRRQQPIIRKARFSALTVSKAQKARARRTGRCIRQGPATMVSATNLTNTLTIHPGS